jgi:hypothetical protein
MILLNSSAVDKFPTAFYGQHSYWHRQFSEGNSTFCFPRQFWPQLLLVHKKLVLWVNPQTHGVSFCPQIYEHHFHAESFPDVWNHSQHNHQFRLASGVTLAPSWMEIIASALETRLRINILVNFGNCDTLSRTSFAAKIIQVEFYTVICFLRTGKDNILIPSMEFNPFQVVPCNLRLNNIRVGTEYGGPDALDLSREIHERQDRCIYYTK